MVSLVCPRCGKDGSWKVDISPFKTYDYDWLSKPMTGLNGFTCTSCGKFWRPTELQVTAEENHSRQIKEIKNPFHLYKPPRLPRLSHSHKDDTEEDFE